MYARKFLAGLATSAVAVSALALSTGAAHAVTSMPDPNDSTGTPVAADLIGVGSDTSQSALKLLADAYDQQTPAPTAPLFTYAATSGGTITLPTADITRPNGSGAGKTLLYGSANNPDIDFARSSSAESTAEQGAGLQSFPFALDTLVSVTSGKVKSNAPAVLTAAQLVQIYEGNTTNWNQIGGTAGTIAPKIPQAGSGTRSFFLAQLQAANGGVAITLGSDVVEIQENDPTLIQSDPNAVGAFSEGRANLPVNAGDLTIEANSTGGFAANRALYNVVRGSDVGLTGVTAAFGSDGFLCSPAAQSLIQAGGFQQLATPAQGGVCGSPTQAATSNFALAGVPVATTTKLTVNGTTPKVAKLVAAVSGTTAPSGTVTFMSGSTVLKANVPLTSGQATYSLPATPGAHSYTATFVPDEGSQFESSTSTASGVVKTTSAISETFPSTVKSNKKASGVVTVTLSGSATKATGYVKVYRGSKLLASKILTSGKASIKLPTLVNGKNALKVVWAGSGYATGSTKTFTIKQVKVKKKK